VSGDGALVASGGDDQTLRLWDLATGAPDLPYEKEGPIGEGGGLIPSPPARGAAPSPVTQTIPAGVIWLHLAYQPVIPSLPFHPYPKAVWDAPPPAPATATLPPPPPPGKQLQVFTEPTHTLECVLVSTPAPRPPPGLSGHPFPFPWPFAPYEPHTTTIHKSRMPQSVA